MATTPQIPLRKGDDLIVGFKCEHDGDDVDITNYTIQGTLTFGNLPPVVLTTTLTAPTAGRGEVSLGEAETLALQVACYELQIRFTTPSGKTTSTLPVPVAVRQ